MELSNNQKHNHSRTVFVIVLCVYIISNFVVIYGLYLRGFLPQALSDLVLTYIFTPTASSTSSPTQTQVPSLTITQTFTLSPSSEPTQANTLLPTLEPTFTPTVQPDPVLDYIDQCLDGGVVNYLILGEKRVKIFTTWSNSDGELEFGVQHIPQCIRFIRFPEIALMLVKAKAFDSTVNSEVKCQIFYRGELVAEDYTTKAGETVECKFIQR
jgi:hypothetical protein